MQEELQRLLRLREMFFLQAKLLLLTKSKSFLHRYINFTFTEALHILQNFASFTSFLFIFIYLQIFGQQVIGHYTPRV